MGALRNTYHVLLLPPAALFLLCSSAHAATRLVLADGTGPYATIQAAVDAAVDGDVVELGDGVFSGAGNVDVLIEDTSISIRSASGNPEACVIDCQGSAADPHFGLQFNKEGVMDCAVVGVTVRGGYGNLGALSAHMLGTLELTDCIFEDNFAPWGGAIGCNDVVLTRCVLRRNRAEFGGALVAGPWG